VKRERRALCSTQETCHEPRNVLHVIGMQAFTRALCPKGALPRLKLGVLFLLAANRGHVMSTEEIVDILYADDPSGGPRCAMSCVNNAVLRLRREGHAIVTHAHKRVYSYDPWASERT